MAYPDDFFDDFNRSDEDLEDSADWTLQDGTAATLLVFSNEIKITNKSAWYSYVCPAQGADAYVVAKRITLASANDGLGVRVVDKDNWVGHTLRGSASAGSRLSKCIASTVTDLITSQGSANEWMKVEASGSTIQFFEGGTGASPGTWNQIGSDQTVTNFQTETSQGFIGYGYTNYVFWDDFGAGALGGSGNPDLDASTGVFTLTGNNATLAKASKLDTSTGSFSLTGNDVTFTYSRKLPTATGAFTLTGNNADLTFTRKLIASSVNFALTGNDVDLTYTPAGANPPLSAETGIFSLTGNNATLAKNSKLDTATGVFTLTGNNADFSVTHKLGTSTGSFVLTGNDAEFTAPVKLEAETGVFLLAGNDAEFTYSGDVGGVGKKRKRKKYLTLPDGKTVIVSGLREAQKLLDAYYKLHNQSIKTVKQKRVKLKPSVSAPVTETVTQYYAPQVTVPKVQVLPAKLYSSTEIEIALRQAAYNKRRKDEEEILLLIA